MAIPKDDLINYIKTADSAQLKTLAGELRNELILDVSKTGGHLASNLGCVELTIALHKVFDLPKDKIIWDVGHQTYVHKMITGRRDRMESLRQLDGLSGFPKRRESACDFYDSGHSGTSISAALGYAAARDIKGEDHACVAVIGDGAMTGGVAFEALNAAGSSKTALIVILNDNAMSISPNVGGLSKHLQKIRSGRSYQRFKLSLKNAFRKTPKILRSLVSLRDAIKYALLEGVIFEELGFKYFGPVDGHDIDAMAEMFTAAKGLGRPVLIHCVTKKGKGFEPAESNPEKYHGCSPFDPETADDVTVRNGDSWSEIFGEALLERAYDDKRICAVTAAMTEGTGLSAMKRQLPARVFDAGIAEQHAVSFSAGLALSGLKPVCALYSTFLQRAYDQVLTEICLQNLPVIFAVDRAGAVGADGETHQGLYDISYLGSMPNMTVLSPRDRDQLEIMLDHALKLDGPCAIRYPRGNAPVLIPGSSGDNGSMEPEFIVKGDDGIILSDGGSLPEALKAADILKNKGINISVVDIKLLKPLPTGFLEAAGKCFKKVATLEDGSAYAGFGIKAAHIMKDSQVLCLGWPDKFIEQGSVSQLKERYGLNGKAIAERMEKFIEDKAGCTIN